MVPRQLIALIVTAISMSSCTPYALYQSPFHNTTNGYKTMPLKSDTPTAQTYVSGSVFGGGTGNNIRDGHSGFVGSVYRAHSTGIIRGYYGLTTTLGHYRVHGITVFNTNDPTRKYPNDSLINARAGSKFFAGMGAVGGLYLALSIPNGSEWRFGVESNWQYEFGSYGSFRKNLPDTAANLVSRPHNFLALSLHTEIVLKTRRGSAGFKFGTGVSARNEKEYYSARSSTLRPWFLATGFQITSDRETWFTQMNMGTYSLNFMTGLNYRL